MGRSLLSMFPSNPPSPWSSPSPSQRQDHSNVNDERDQSSSEYRPLTAQLFGSPPVMMTGAQHQTGHPFAVDRPHSSGLSSFNPTQLTWSTNLNTPYGIIGSNMGMPMAQQGRTENQPGPSQRPSETPSAHAPSAGTPGWETSAVPLSPLSGTSYQASFLPIFGPPGTRQGFLMPTDWALNPHGFMVSENARRINALPFEAEITEQDRRVGPGGQGAPAVGCHMCAISPRLMLLPCEHTVCSECGSRFMSASSGMYCSCGELVSSMINLNAQYPWNAPPRSNVIGPPPGLPVPSYGDLQTTPTPRNLSAPRLPGVMPAAQSAQLQQHQQVAFPSALPRPISSSPLFMDAETAIENSPFWELGRHALAQNWCCVKISNIPYSVTAENIMEFLGKNAKVVPDEVGLSVHIIMDRASGKTMDAFVEFTCPKDAYRCVTRKRGKILGTRHVTLDVVSQEELMREIFPKARGVTWEGVIPKILNTQNGNTKADLVTKEELVLVVGHARTPHRSPFSRKCLQRPYESILSIVAKFPWFAVNVYTIQQRDIIFNGLLSTIDILKRQCKRGRTTPNLDTELLKRLCKAGVTCTGFTNAQKREIVRMGEFGAEGLEAEVEDDVPGFEGLFSLSRKPAADIRTVELYSMVASMQNNPCPQPFGSASERSNDPEKQTAISRLPSGLIDELDDPGHSSPEPSYDTIRIAPPGSLTEQELELRLKNTMAAMAELEWAAIEKCVRAVLPPRARTREALMRLSSNVAYNNVEGTSHMGQMNLDGKQQSHMHSGMTGN